MSTAATTVSPAAGTAVPARKNHPAHPRSEATMQHWKITREAEIERHCHDGALAEDRVGYKRLGSGIEKAIVAYQSRRGG